MIQIPKLNDGFSLTFDNRDNNVELSLIIDIREKKNVMLNIEHQTNFRIRFVFYCTTKRIPNPTVRHTWG